MAPEKLGPYRIERQLGRGGMGTVFAAVDETTGRRVAVKVLAASLAADESFRQRFQSEIESLIKLRHPHIVEIFAYGEQDGHHFYAMELVDGCSLYEEQKGGRKFTWREVALLGLEMCKALKHAHDHGVIHRDLKPANLLLDRAAGVKLSDFGIAKLFGGTHVTSDGGVIGTADFMSPEQAEGSPVTQRCDLYSLGGVFYALLSGRPPLVGKSLPDLLHMLRYADPPPVRTFAPQTPLEFEQLIRELLAKSPQQRVPTAIAVQRRLEAILKQPAETGYSAPVSNNKENASPTLAEGQGAGTSAIPASPNDQRTQPDGGGSANPALTRPLPDQTLPSAGMAPKGENQPTSAGKPRTVVGSEQPTSAGSPAELGLAADSPTRETQFTVVDEMERRRRTSLPLGDEAAPNWPKVAGLVVILATLAVIVGYALQPPSPETMLQRVRTAAAHDDPASLSEAEADINRLLQGSLAEAERQEVATYAEEVELYRLEKRFERQLRRPSADELSPAERAYLEATHLADFDLERGAARLQAIIAMFEGQPGASDRTRQCVELARRKLARLSRVLEESIPAQKQLATEQLARATELAEKSPGEAAALCQALIELYAEKEWASTLVIRARALLSQVRAGKANTSP